MAGAPASQQLPPGPEVLLALPVHQPRGASCSSREHQATSFPPGRGAASLTLSNPTPGCWVLHARSSSGSLPECHSLFSLNMALCLQVSRRRGAQSGQAGSSVSYLAPLYTPMQSLGPPQRSPGPTAPSQKAPPGPGRSAARQERACAVEGDDPPTPRPGGARDHGRLPLLCRSLQADLGGDPRGRVPCPRSHSGSQAAHRLRAEPPQRTVRSGEP